MIPADGGWPACGGGYRMVDSITIRNFRSFDEVKLDGFRRINLVVGDNGSGKTALLEAMFLAAGISPELAMRTRAWRGQENARLTGSREDIHHALWADMFHKFNTRKPAYIQLKGSGEENRSVTVTLNPRGKVRVEPPSRKSSGAPPRVVPEPSPIEFRWNIQGQPTINVKPVFDDEKLVFPPISDAYVKAAFFASHRTSSTLEVTARFSALSRTFREHNFIDHLNRLYPHIKDLSVELSAGTPMIFAMVDGLPEKIPLTLASGGISKLASILLAITDQAGGIVIVDELENGFYHSRLSKVWLSLLEFAKANDCQLFLSSHSAECLEAAAELAKDNPKDFSVVRTVLKNGATIVRQFDGNTFAEAIEEHVDVR